ADRVTFNQIVGFIGFQARVIAVLQALNGQPARWLPGIDIQQDAPVERFAAAAAPQWQSDIPLPAPGYLRPEQTQALTEAQRIEAMQPLAEGLVGDEAALSLLSALVEALYQGPDAALVAL